VHALIPRRRPAADGEHGSRRSSTAGLHEFLVEFIRRNQAVANAIAEQYRFTA
jgi:uncharacterized alpha-E superfamily protein